MQDNYLVFSGIDNVKRTALPVLKRVFLPKASDLFKDELVQGPEVLARVDFADSGLLTLCPKD